MRKLISIASIAILIAVLALPLAAGAEMRGLWVDAFHPGYKTPEQTAAMVAKAKECNFTDLFVQVRKRGDVYYKSAIEPMADDVAAGYDPLSDVVEKAHAVGMKVHAWIIVYEVYHDSPWSQVGDNHPYKKHSEWLAKDEQGRTSLPGDRAYLDPGLPEVRRYLASISEEIAKGYGVDGIHLDAVRYPSESAGYNESSVSLFNQATKKNGKPKLDDKDWCDWRRNQVTELVRLTKDAVKKTRPKALLSASVFPNLRDAYSNRMQDWVGWLDKGLLDFAVPMVFALDNRAYEKLTADVLSAGSGKSVCIGQGGWRIPASQSLEQISIARKAGSPGFVVYSYYYCSQVKPDESVSLMDMLKGK